MFATTGITVHVYNSYFTGLMDVETDNDDNNEDIQETSVECYVPPAVDTLDKLVISPTEDSPGYPKMLRKTGNCDVASSASAHKTDVVRVQSESQAGKSKPAIKTKRPRWTSFKQK